MPPNAPFEIEKYTRWVYPDKVVHPDAVALFMEKLIMTSYTHFH